MIPLVTWYVCYKDLSTMHKFSNMCHQDRRKCFLHFEMWKSVKSTQWQPSSFQFHWQRFENRWFNNSHKSPLLSRDWVTVSAGDSTPPWKRQWHNISATFASFVEMWKPDCVFLWVPFEIRHTWPSLGCDFTACSGLFLETSYTPQLV